MSNLINLNLCIICQKNKNIKVISTENGRNNIIRATEIRKDEVYNRLQVLANSKYFLFIFARI